MDFDYKTWYSILKAIVFYLLRFVAITGGGDANTTPAVPKVAIQLKDSKTNFRTAASLNHFRQQTLKRSPTLQ